jgi:hypothetical protein
MGHKKPIATLGVLIKAGGSSRRDITATIVQRSLRNPGDDYPHGLWDALSAVREVIPGGPDATVIYPQKAVGKCLAELGLYGLLEGIDKVRGFEEAVFHPATRRMSQEALKYRHKTLATVNKSMALLRADRYRVNGTKTTPWRAIEDFAVSVGATMLVVNRDWFPMTDRSAQDAFEREVYRQVLAKAS